ncbi:MAG: LysM peptidoglycan-binding domain-containing protein [Myxococcales bacterium]|nr:LysM peptidoglycan-binding domain-containing protein [Myxococcales bacterium]
MRTNVLLIVVGSLAIGAGCKGPESSSRQLLLAVDSDRLAVEMGDGPRREAAEATMRKEAKRVARSFFQGDPMPAGAPVAEGGADDALAAPRPETPERPSWADGVPKPPTDLEHDLPRAFPVEVRRGETPALLAGWAGTDARTLLSDNEESLKGRKWFKTGDRLSVTMSQNQKVAFDRAREAYQEDRMSEYFARRYFEKVVVYRVKRGEYLSKAAKRYGDVPLWLLEEFNQMDFRSLQPGDEVLIPVVATLESGQKAPPPLRVVDEDGRPLADEGKQKIAERLRTDLIGRARMALDDSNVFERNNDAFKGTTRDELLPDYLEVRTEVTASGDTGEPAAVNGPAAVARAIIVKPGETLMHYVSWSGVSMDAIKAANPALDPNRILVGARLALPLDDVQYVGFMKARADWAAAGGAAAEKKAAAAAEAARKPVRHVTVKKGDTASRIAKRQKIALGALRKANPGVDLGRLSIGQELVLP